MNTLTKAKSCLAVLIVSLAGASCVSHRPARNGVFNENQYLRKDFLIKPGDDSQSDPGWYMQVSITSASQPNPLAYVGGASMFAGIQSSGFGGPDLVRFAVTQDKLQILDMRELNNDPTSAAEGLRTPAIINAWPVTNVDLKYRINLDGENTNFFEENQELDWQVRQWIKVNFDKNDLSDLQPFFGSLNQVIMNCTDFVEGSASMIPNSFNVDTDNGYWEVGVSVTLPISYTPSNAATCMQAFGPAAASFAAMGRSTVTLNLLYSFVRPDKFPGNPLDGSYVPMAIDEKDAIQHKYGPIEVTTPFRDPDTGLMGAKEFVARFHPNKDIVFYLAKGMPEEYRQFFVAKGGIVDQTNQVLAKAGGTGRLKILNYNDAQTYGDAAGPERHFGDARYSFIVWHSDMQLDEGLLGVEQQFVNPLTGQTLAASVNVWEGRFKDTVEQKLDLFLQTVGAEYLKNPSDPNSDFDDTKYPSSCMDGQSIPLVDGDIAQKLNSQSTVYGKMQAYMQKPISQFGTLGPTNFLPTHDADFYNAYFAVIPYQIYADPQANQFVSPDGSVFGASAQENWKSLQKLAQFDELAAQIDHGAAPWDTSSKDGIDDALAFHHKFNDLALAVNEHEHVRARSPLPMRADDISLFSYLDIYQKNGRHCVNGKWESRADYTNRLITSLNAATAMHEFGHALGLDHNFMGSVDQRNFPLDKNGKPTLFSSSIMEYNQQFSEAFFLAPGAAAWPPYDAAALGWIYGNDLDGAHTIKSHDLDPAAKGISGQTSPTAPWNDPLGWVNGAERSFLFCTNKHTAYTPLCRPYDIGVTPSEIIANEIQAREWNYLWTNFRLYHKYFDLTNYGQNTVNSFLEYRRFVSLWNFDWSPGELTNTLRLIGINPPQGATAGDYYTQLTNKFNQDLSIANQLTASYHRAIIDQASGERPFITIFDPYYGDTTQQGIQIDKLVAVSSFASLWPAISNFDPSQSGAYELSSSFGDDPAFNNLASSVMLDFLGANFATYTYAQLGPIATFAEASHSSFWPEASPAQAWIGGYSFERERDFLDYLHAIAVKYKFQNCDENGLNCSPCTSLDNCTWDPRTPQVKASQITQSDRYNRFQTPDGRTFIWMYVASRNQWVLADKDRNVALFTLILNWTTDVVNGEDDGYAGSLALELKVRYALDAYEYFNNYQPNSQ